MTSSPTTRTLPPAPLIRRRLGTSLRQLRNHQGLRLADVAAKLDVTPSTLSRIETGQAPARTSYVAVMLDLYGVSDQNQRTLLTDLAREGQRKQWWSDCEDLLTAGTSHYFALESEAIQIRTYSAGAIPDLLQTPEYATAAIRAARPGLRAEQVSQLAKLQVRRREQFARNATRLHAIIDETALRKPITSVLVMADQLADLLATVAGTAITIQAISASAPVSILSPPFTLLDFGGDPATSGVACCHAPGAQILTARHRDGLTSSQTTFEAMVQAALTPSDTAAMLAELADH